MEKIYNKFTNLYSISKTLRFELKPQGKTLDNIKKNGVIENDENKADNYTKVKKIIDQYHKYYIDMCMEKYNIPLEDLNDYIDFLKNKDKDKLKSIKEKMRKQISNAFTKNKLYNQLFNKKMITDLLPNFNLVKEDFDSLKDFSDFYTYFKGFNENRKNMYVSDEKSTSISYRLINENLPIFVENMEKFQYIEKVIGDKIKIVEEELNEYIQVADIGEMFNIEYYNDVLTQNGIDIYNIIIGGKSTEKGNKIKGINEYINEYKQKNPHDNKIAKLNTLRKQILSDKETASFVIEKFESDQDVLDAINELSIKMKECILNGKLEKLFKNISKYDITRIYIKNDISITNISETVFNDWSYLSNSISKDYDDKHGVPTTKTAKEKKKKYLKNKKNISIDYINSCIKDNNKEREIQKYFENCIYDRKENVFEKTNNSYNKIKELLEKEYSSENNLKKDSKNIKLIKDYLDSLKEIQLFIKPLVGIRFEESEDKDNRFYDELFKYWDCLMELNKVYDKVRNYVTSKPYSLNKIKLNFNNPTLLGGWVNSKETDYSSILFRKDEMYYLGIINKNYNKNFKNYPKPEDSNDIIEKMIYLQAADPQKDVQNLMVIDGKTVKKNGRKDDDGINRQLEELKNKYLPEEINRIRKSRSYSKASENFNQEDLIKYIDYYKERTNEYFNKYKFEFKKSEEYRDFADFTSHINEQAYQISFKKVSKKYIDSLVEEGKLYLFQIYNKDFSKFSKGKPNLHTIYWKELFNEDNLKNTVYKLNGEAEIFYRKASIDKKITHPKNLKIKNKNTNNPKTYSEFDYDLIKDKRFTEDKFQLHVSVSLNYKAQGISNINENVNKAIKNNKENYIIGIDRGERHLLYLVLINEKGEIIEQYSLNEIINENKGIQYKNDYHSLLDQRESERESARESWQLIENIKNLKEGYLSQVINKITDLMIKYNAIVVLEDLNFGFMRGRQKFEKQVYQKFEKMLIDKLNYLVKKDINENEYGGALKAYQLANQFESFKKLGKQSGFLYYVPAWNTSKIDPITGFVNLFYIKYENMKKTKEFFNLFEDIRYNSKKDFFEFDIDYSKFGNKAEGTKEKWTICSYGNRIINKRSSENNNHWISETIDITEEFKKLFANNKIDIKSNDFMNIIISIEDNEFWKELLYLFKLCLQIRNSVIGSSEDYLLSPVMNEKGEFFDSRKANKKMPDDADANGAYNIARKGLFIIKKIKNTPENEINKIKLTITNKEWLQFIQNKEWYK